MTTDSLIMSRTLCEAPSLMKIYAESMPNHLATFVKEVKQHLLDVCPKGNSQRNKLILSIFVGAFQYMLPVSIENASNKHKEVTRKLTPVQKINLYLDKP